MNHALIEVARKAWPFDSTPMSIGVESGIVWAISRGFAGVNGYVLIPAEGHPWSAGIPYGREDEYAHEYLEVHGGITYNGKGWLGFDTAHTGDMWDGEFDPYDVCRHAANHPGSKRWTVELVIEEARSLARQLASLPEIV